MASQKTSPPEPRAIPTFLPLSWSRVSTFRPTTAIHRTRRVACATTTTLGSRLWLATPAISEPKADSIWPFTRKATIAEPEGPVLMRTSSPCFLNSPCCWAT